MLKAKRMLFEWKDGAPGTNRVFTIGNGYSAVVTKRQLDDGWIATAQSTHLGTFDDKQSAKDACEAHIREFAQAAVNSASNFLSVREPSEAALALESLLDAMDAVDAEEDRVGPDGKGWSSAPAINSVIKRQEARKVLERSTFTTSDDLARDIAHAFRNAAEYWSRVPTTNADGSTVTIEERCHGVAFSICAALDGCGSLPPIQLSVEHPPDDGEEYDETHAGSCVSCHIHDLYYKVT